MNDEVKLNLNEKGFGAFTISENDALSAEMVLSIENQIITVYHTEVFPQAEGKGFAKKLLSTLVEYAREHSMKIIPLCPFVHAQFNRHPAEYEDVWLKTNE